MLDVIDYETGSGQKILAHLKEPKRNSCAKSGSPKYFSAAMQRLMERYHRHISDPAARLM